MPRIARIVIPEIPYHITQRGNYQQDIFINDDDRRKYLFWIDEYSRKYNLKLYAFCLMGNHVHFIAVPLKKDSLAKVFSIAHMRYSQYFNKKRKTTGHLWQGRFYSCCLDEAHFILAARYVERNPVRAKIVRRAWEYEWSSALKHTANTKSIINLAELSEIIDMSGFCWEDYLQEREDRQKNNEIRKHTILGRPLGANGFIKKLAKKTGKELIFNPRGRPAKNKK